MEYEISYDVSNFLDASIEMWYTPLRDAFILVALVVLSFSATGALHSFPPTAVPISLIGAFIFMQLFGLPSIWLHCLLLCWPLVLWLTMPLSSLRPCMQNGQRAIVGLQGCSVAKYCASGLSLPLSPCLYRGVCAGCLYVGARGVFCTVAFNHHGKCYCFVGTGGPLTPVLCAMIWKNTHGNHEENTCSTVFWMGFNEAFEKLTGRYVALLKNNCPPSVL